MKTKRILIIDDEVDFTYLLRRYFESKNCSVDIAHNLTFGMEKLASFEPDFVFLDNNLPDGLGWEKAGYILENFPNAGLYLMSGIMTPFYQYGNLRILEKPFSLVELDKILNAKRA